MTQFNFGPIPELFSPDESWRALDEPSPEELNKSVAPIAAILAFVFVLSWLEIGVTSLSIFTDHGLFSGFSVLGSLALLIIVHELIHALTQPGLGMSAHTVVGIVIKHGLFYAAYMGPISRNRYLVVLLAPFAMLSFLPLLFGAIGVIEGSFLQWAGWLSTWNAAFACGDLYGAYLILKQIPASAQLQNKGWFTYWRI